MNLWQIAHQLRYKLQDRDWPSSSTAVFDQNAVVCTPGLDLDELKNLVHPVALIFFREEQSDPEHGEAPDYREGRIIVRVGVDQAGDRYGQHSLLGASRTGQTDSRGRGLLELDPEINGAIGDLAKQDGLWIRSDMDGAAEVTPEPLPHLTYRDHAFKVRYTMDRFYPPPFNFTATDQANGSDVALAWSLPPTRYDTYRVILRRASGSTAPADKDSGTSISLSGNLATSKTDDPGTGTFSYALFLTYDEEDIRPGGTPDSDDRVSEQATGTTRTVTVT